jgi:hypothetical protein
VLVEVLPEVPEVLPEVPEVLPEVPEVLPEVPEVLPEVPELVEPEALGVELAAVLVLPDVGGRELVVLVTLLSTWLHAESVSATAVARVSRSGFKSRIAAHIFGLRK